MWLAGDSQVNVMLPSDVFQPGLSRTRAVIWIWGFSHVTARKAFNDCSGAAGNDHGLIEGLAEMGQALRRLFGHGLLAG